MIEPPCTERYARWCERSATQLMGSLLLDFGGQGWIRTIEVVDGRFTVDTIILYKPSKLEQLGKYQYLGVYLIHISNTQ